MIKVKKYTGRFFLLHIIALLIFGIIILASASSPYGYNSFDDPYYFVKRQIIGILVGLFFFFIFSRFNWRFWKKVSTYFYIACVILLILVFIPGIGADFGKNAHSWLDIGSLNLQPAEFAKLGIILILAKLLSSQVYNLKDWKGGLLPILLYITPAVLLILLQPDIGTLAVVAGIIFGMLYLAKLPKSYLAIIFGLGIFAFGILILISPYRMNRFTIFLHPELDPQGVGYHVNQAYLAVGSGGLFGVGYGQSRQKYQYLPEVQADSIYAILAEELGFIASSALVVLIFLMVWRGFRLARESLNDFNYLAISGIMIWFFWQSCINIGAMIGLLPLTGVTLPFISHGGSSMMACLAAVGVVIGISRRQD